MLMQKALLAVVSVVITFTVGCHMTTSTDEDWFGSTFDKYKPKDSGLVAINKPGGKERTFVMTSGQGQQTAIAANQGVQYIQKTDNLFVISDASSSASEVYEDSQNNYKLAANSKSPSKFEVEKEILRRMNDTMANIAGLKFTASIRSFGYGNCYRGEGQTYQHLAPVDYSKIKFGEVLLEKKDIKNLPKKEYERLQSLRMDCAHGRSLVTNAIGYDKCDDQYKTGSKGMMDCYGELHLTDAVTNPLFDKLGLTDKEIEKRKNGSVRQDLQNTKGNIALVIISDGNLDLSHGMIVPQAVVAIQQLVEKYPNRICVYTIYTGNPNDEKANGKSILETYSAVTLPQCQTGFDPGFKPSVTAQEVSTPEGMGTFVHNVFFRKIQPTTMIADCSTLDADSDGVNDCNDKCPKTLKGAHVNKFGCWFVDVKFDNDKSNIKPRYYAELNNTADVINDNPGLKFEVQGHTSNTWTAPYNMKLSERRANAVLDYLKHKVNNPGALTAHGYGLTRPIDTNDTEEGRANNRRVQLEVIE